MFSEILDDNLVQYIHIVQDVHRVQDSTCLAKFRLDQVLTRTIVYIVSYSIDSA